MKTLRYRLLIRLRPALRFVKFRIFHLEDSPERIARGAAIGLFFAYLPLLGLQMILAFLTAKWTKANKAVAVMTTWVSNPLTAMAVFYPCYRIGRVVLSLFHKKAEVDAEQLEFILEEHLSFWEMIWHLFSYDYWKHLAAILAKIGLEIFIGGVILGIFIAAAGYWLTYKIIISYRRRKKKRLLPSAGINSGTPDALQ
ncbi:MAG TPA: DUF2062 domain-containing protein [Anaerohalosphaeraceae bacterium]|nr:DUF2062 domain-containing protein [Phycisphaerae bacterium]HOK96077.1 DUF2062 domain-containing protein [Anaerohalosphaeraceae bacterium]HOL30787.1 DUF2062 domain-containing protein [Anaerohalosphaeraceae bacterium]HOM76544.1 DUF2062 domain-containing protein [Anaerohalosphaeraceae bacterium]HPC63702.1 DUF2062 domain-containing protein [Anaerohalosphaeraceae bacterium]